MHWGMSGGVDWGNRTAPDFERATTRGERFRLSENFIMGRALLTFLFFVLAANYLGLFVWHVWRPKS
jgi:hypothetical protein